MGATQLFGSTTDRITTFKNGKINDKTWQPNFSMDKATQDYFKDLLLRKLDDLKLEAEKTVARMTDNVANFPDPTDRAALESDRNFMLSIRDRERKLILKIREALQRIEEGIFGQCEQCGDDIGIERLNARPTATLCIECKRSQEANERFRGQHVEAK